MVKNKFHQHETRNADSKIKKNGSNKKRKKVKQVFMEAWESSASAAVFRFGSGYRGIRSQVHNSSYARALTIVAGASLIQMASAEFLPSLSSPPEPPPETQRDEAYLGTYVGEPANKADVQRRLHPHLFFFGGHILAVLVDFHEGEVFPQ